MNSAAGLAWRQLRRQKVRFAVAIAGVAFAVVLMFMQVGFRDALFRGAVNLHQRLEADLVLIQPNYNILAFPTTFSRRRLYQALGVRGVRSVTPLYTAVGRWKNPVTGRTRDIFTIGIDPRSEEHTSELQSQSNLVCRLLLEKKKKEDTQTGVLDISHTEAVLG